MVSVFPVTFYLLTFFYYADYVAFWDCADYIDYFDYAVHADQADSLD